MGAPAAVAAVPGLPEAGNTFAGVGACREDPLAVAAASSCLGVAFAADNGVPRVPEHALCREVLGAVAAVALHQRRHSSLG